MSSAALDSWRTVRTSRLDRLQAAHGAIGGAGPGRRWVTEELNHAMILRLASEFQGFARDLHDETALAVVARLAPTDLRLRSAISAPYLARRRLDRGNAEPGNLGQDFGLFGFTLWPGLRQSYPQRAPQWHSKLLLLNHARNGVAHDDGDRLRRVVEAGWPLTLGSVLRWRRALDGLARGMDHVVGRQFCEIYGGQPW
jgi:hypothetical protein